MCVKCVCIDAFVLTFTGSHLPPPLRRLRELLHGPTQYSVRRLRKSRRRTCSTPKLGAKSWAVKFHTYRARIRCAASCFLRVLCIVDLPPVYRQRKRSILGSPDEPTAYAVILVIHLDTNQHGELGSLSRLDAVHFIPLKQGGMLTAP